MNINSDKTEFAITSAAFNNKGDIPLKYAHENAGGENMSMPVSWSGAPKDAKSLVLLVYDIHPVAHDFVHWLVTDIGTSVTEIAEGASGTKKMPAGAVELKTSYGKAGYGGPCPPKGSGKHPYFVIIYALNTEKLEIHEPISYAAIKRALEGKVLEQAEIQGYYER